MEKRTYHCPKCGLPTARDGIARSHACGDWSFYTSNVSVLSEASLRLCKLSRRTRKPHRFRVR